MNSRNVRQWIELFNNGEFDSHNRYVQIDAGWYDWFCRDTSLRNKTYRMGNIIKQIKPNGKVDMDNWYVWFKNNCPLRYPLFDDFRFATINDGEVQMTITIDNKYEKHRYCVYGRKTVGGKFEDDALFKCDNSKELVKWLNTPWDK